MVEMMKKYLLIAYCLFSLPVMAAPLTVPVEQFGNASFTPTNGDSAGFIVLLSPSTGWDAASAAVAASLSAQHYAVLGLDVKTYLTDRAKTNDTCLYPAGVIEETVQNLEKKYGGDHSYQTPIIVGLGDSGGFATVTGLQILPTFSAIIAPAFCPQLNTPKPLCSGDRLLEQKNLYTVIKPIEEKLYLHPALNCAMHSWPTATTGLNDSLKELQTTPSAELLDDLPLTPLRGTATNPWLVVFYSGDGGWRDIDKQMGGALQNAGYNVIGVDSLRYFWKEKTPAATAADLDRIISTYSRAWRTSKVAIVGFSFGADILPFTVPLSTYKSRIQQIVMLQLSKNANFEIELDNFLGEGDATYDTLKAYPSLAPIKTLCLYGSEETEDDDSACPHMTQPFVEKIELPGDHHFNGAYDQLVKIIKDRLR